MSNRKTAKHLTIDDVVTWIGHIGDESIDSVLEALHERHEALNVERVEAAVDGADVEIGDVDPEYLVGLRGVIAQVEDEEYVTIKLDEASTATLRFVGRDWYDVGSEKNYLLPHIPARCCFPLEEAFAKAV